MYLKRRCERRDAPPAHIGAWQSHRLLRQGCLREKSNEIATSLTPADGGHEFLATTCIEPLWLIVIIVISCHPFFRCNNFIVMRLRRNGFVSFFLSQPKMWSAGPHWKSWIYMKETRRVSGSVTRHHKIIHHSLHISRSARIYHKTTTRSKKRVCWTAMIYGKTGVKKTGVLPAFTIKVVVICDFLRTDRSFVPQEACRHLPRI